MDMKLNENRYRCNHCELKYATAQELMEHYLNEHPDSREASKIRFQQRMKDKPKWKRIRRWEKKTGD